MPAERGGERDRTNGFELFDLTVYVGSGLVPWLSAASRLGHVQGIPRRDPKVPSIDEMLDSVYDFVDAVRFAERDPDPLLAQGLGQLVFGEPAILDLFQATRGAAADRGREMLVRILASPHLAALPWELLPDPAEGPVESGRRFLALAPDASVVRLARGRTYPVRSDPVDPPLNLLVVLSSPIAPDPADDSLAFDIYEEKRALLDELRPLVDAGLLTVDVEERPTLENLRRQIGKQRRGYHLFHYLGHAEPDRLILEDEQGRRDDQSGTRFTQILRLCPDLRLAVFAGCETARAPRDPVASDAAVTEEWRNIFSLADRCVQDCSPIVVGMQAVLPFRTERLFTRFFYQGIVSGYSVAASMRLARGAARGDRHVGGDLLDWSVPVLFVGGSDPGPLLERSAAVQKPEPPPRHLLRLGLLQRETQFFARDVALRQAIDILSGEAPERVLIVTGPPGVGKTFLVDRALEEIGGPISILYVKFDALMPASGAASSEAVLERLCGLVAELLSRTDGRRRALEQGRKASDWWPWLVEDLTAMRFLLVIDNFDRLATMEQDIVRQLVPFWLAPQLSEFLPPARKRKTASKRNEPRELSDVLDEFIDRLRDPQASARPNQPSNPLLDGLGGFDKLLGAAGRSTRSTAVLVEQAQQRLEELQRDGTTVEEVVQRTSALVGSDQERAALQAKLADLSETRRVMEGALRSIAERRSHSRVAVIESRLPEGLAKLPADWRFEMRLGHLTWSETWRWIHRNLPGLLRYGEPYLARLWSRLGPNLESWEELERRVLASTTDDVVPAAFVEQIAPRPTPKPRDRRAPDTRARTERPLRVAVAGPHLAGADALALAFSRLAAEYVVGGRVVPGSDGDTASLAVLVDTPTPFREREGVVSALESDILQWIDRVSEQQADVILLDYGSPIVPKVDTPPRAQQLMLQRLRHRALLIAAGGNDELVIPAAYPEVLAVGSIAADRNLRPYAAWTPARRKPDIFMEDNLAGTALEEALREEERTWKETSKLMPDPGTHGSSFAAFHAVAAAVLVWSTLPWLSPLGVRRLLTMAARPLSTGNPNEPAPLRLTIADALTHARRELVLQTLAGGPCSIQTLAAITGLDLRVVIGTIKNLLADAQPKIRLLSRGRLERYELIEASPQPVL